MDEFEVARRTEKEMEDALRRMEAEATRFQEDARHVAENMKSALEESKAERRLSELEGDPLLPSRSQES